MNHRSRRLNAIEREFTEQNERANRVERTNTREWRALASLCSARRTERSASATARGCRTRRAGRGGQCRASRATRSGSGEAPVRTHNTTKHNVQRDMTAIHSFAYFRVLCLCIELSSLPTASIDCFPNSNCQLEREGQVDIEQSVVEFR